MLDFKVYISKPFIKDFLTFKEMTGNGASRTLCCIMRQFVNANISIDVPTIRNILVKNPDDIRKLRELLKEFD